MEVRLQRPHMNIDSSYFGRRGGCGGPQGGFSKMPRQPRALPSPLWVDRCLELCEREDACRAFEVVGAGSCAADSSGDNCPVAGCRFFHDPEVGLDAREYPLPWPDDAVPGTCWMKQPPGCMRVCQTEPAARPKEYDPDVHFQAALVWTSVLVAAAAMIMFARLLYVTAAAGCCRRRARGRGAPVASAASSRAVPPTEQPDARGGPLASDLLPTHTVVGAAGAAQGTSAAEVELECVASAADDSSSGGGIEAEIAVCAICLCHLAPGDVVVHLCA